MTSKSYKLDSSCVLNLPMTNLTYLDASVDYDYSGNGNNVLFTNFPQGRKVKRAGTKCVSFDNTATEFGEMADSSSLDVTVALTVSYWVKHYSLNANQGHLVKWDYQTQASWAIQTNTSANDGRLTVFFPISLTAGGSDKFDTDIVLKLDTWQHIVVVYDGSGATNADKTRLYVDGVLKSVVFSGTIPSSLQNSTATLKMSEFGGTLHRFLYGKLANIKIFNRVLPEKEILNIFKSEYIY